MRAVYKFESRQYIYMHIYIILKSGYVKEIMFVSAKLTSSHYRQKEKGSALGSQFNM